MPIGRPNGIRQVGVVQAPENGQGRSLYRVIHQDGVGRQDTKYATVGQLGRGLLIFLDA